MTVDPAVTAVWKDRHQQIFPAEVLAVSAALENHSESLRGRDIIWFVDHDSACSTLIRGASQEGDVHGIAECTMYLAMRLSIRIWYEWADSKANPSDGLSREGAADSVYGGVAL